jgi:hypothetical protein
VRGGGGGKGVGVESHGGRKAGVEGLRDIETEGQRVEGQGLRVKGSGGMRICMRMRIHQHIHIHICYVRGGILALPFSALRSFSMPVLNLARKLCNPAGNFMIVCLSSLQFRAGSWGWELGLGAGAGSWGWELGGSWDTDVR